MTTKQPDWEAIEAAFRVGSLSVRAIADKFETKESTIRSRVKTLGWQQDLSEKVKAATKHKLSRTPSRTSVAHEEMRDEDIVDEASDVAASIVVSHRADLAQWRGIANKLCDALQDIDVTTDNHGDFARSLNAGVDAQLKVIKGERQAYNLDTETGDKTVSDLAAMMDDLSKEA